MGRETSSHWQSVPVWVSPPAPPGLGHGGSSYNVTTALGNLIHMYIGMRGRPYGRTTITQLLGRKRRRPARQSAPPHMYYRRCWTTRPQGAWSRRTLAQRRLERASMRRRRRSLERPRRGARQVAEGRQARPGRQRAVAARPTRTCQPKGCRKRGPLCRRRNADRSTEVGTMINIDGCRC